MRKTTSVLTYLLFVLTIVYPAGSLLTACLGYTFELVSVSAFAIANAIIAVLATSVFEGAPKNKIIQILLAVMAPLSLINAVCYMLECFHFWIASSVLVSAGCCCYLSAKYGRPKVLKIVALVLSGLMALPVGFISFIVLIFGNIGQNTVVQTVESPSGKYYAEVIDSNQGALGGDTLVDVHEKSVINVILFRVEKEPQRVYSGEWGAFEGMQIYWKDDDCIVINEREYEVE